MGTPLFPRLEFIAERSTMTLRIWAILLALLLALGFGIWGRNRIHGLVTGLAIALVVYLLWGLLGLPAIPWDRVPGLL